MAVTTEDRCSMWRGSEPRLCDGNDDKSKMDGDTEGLALPTVAAATTMPRRLPGIAPAVSNAFVVGNALSEARPGCDDRGVGVPLPAALRMGLDVTPPIESRCGV